jgi:uncharacterized protein YlxW (UPF0749 family)
MLLQVRPARPGESEHEGAAQPGEGGAPAPGEDGAGGDPDGAPPARTRPVWARLVGAVLVAGLGFAVPVAVRSYGPDPGLARAREGDLVRSLDGLDAERERLRGELDELARAKAELAAGGGPGAELDQARRRAASLAVLAGTAPARGPGVDVVVADPQGSVDGAVLVDALQELRDAGAETMEINGVRVAVSTSVLDNPAGGLVVDGTAVTPPYRLAAIGDGHTLAQAMQIPGGVLDTVASRRGANATVASRERIEIRSLRPPPNARYARPAG